MAIPYIACMILAAKLYGLPPRVLPAIQAVEGGYPETVRINTDRSADLGVMQVNTRWLPALAMATYLPVNVVRNRLTTQPCFNIAASGAIMRSALNETLENLLRAIGDYHSHIATLNEVYQLIVLQSPAIIFQKQRGGK